MNNTDEETGLGVHTRRWPVIGLGLAVLWLFVRDVTLTVSGVLGELLIGLLAGGGIAYVLRRMYKPEINVVRGASVLPYVVLYIANFLKELVYANIAVLKLVLSPSLPIAPRVIEVPLRVESDAAITLIANSITLTPGTLTMDYNPQKHALYVHAISGKDRDAVLAPIRRWEELAAIIFDEDLETQGYPEKPWEQEQPEPVPVVRGDRP